MIRTGHIFLILVLLALPSAADEVVKPLEELRRVSDLTLAEQALVKAFLKKHSQVQHDSLPEDLSKTSGGFNWREKLRSDSFERISKVVPALAKQVTDGVSFRRLYVERLAGDLDDEFFGEERFDRSIAQRLLGGYRAVLRAHNRTGEDLPMDPQIAENNAHEKTLIKAQVPRDLPTRQWDPFDRKVKYRNTEWLLAEKRPGNKDVELPPKTFVRWLDAEIFRIQEAQKRLNKYGVLRLGDPTLGKMPMAKDYLYEVVEDQEAGLKRALQLLQEYRARKENLEVGSAQDPQQAVTNASTKAWQKRKLVSVAKATGPQDIEQEELLSRLEEIERLERQVPIDRRGKVFGDEEVRGGTATLTGKYPWLYDLHWAGLRPSAERLKADPQMAADLDYWDRRSDRSKKGWWIFKKPTLDRFLAPEVWARKRAEQRKIWRNRGIKVAAAAALLGLGNEIYRQGPKMPLIGGLVGGLTSGSHEQEEKPFQVTEDGYNSHSGGELDLPSLNGNPKNSLSPWSGDQKPLYRFAPVGTHTLAEIPTTFELLNRGDYSKSLSEIVDMPLSNAVFKIEAGRLQNTRRKDSSDSDPIAIPSPEGYKVKVELRDEFGKPVSSDRYGIERNDKGKVFVSVGRGSYDFTAYYFADPSVVFPNHAAKDTLDAIPLPTLGWLSEQSRQAGFVAQAEEIDGLIHRAMTTDTKVYPTDLAEAQVRSTRYSSIPTADMPERDLFNTYSAYHVFLGPNGMACFECDGGNAEFSDVMHQVIAETDSRNFVDQEVLLTRKPGDTEAHALHVRNYARASYDARERVVIDATPIEFDSRHLAAVEKARAEARPNYSLIEKWRDLWRKPGAIPSTAPSAEHDQAEPKPVPAKPQPQKTVEAPKPTPVPAVPRKKVPIPAPGSVAHTEVFDANPEVNKGSTEKSHPSSTMSEWWKSLVSEFTVQMRPQAVVTQVRPRHQGVSLPQNIATRNPYARDALIRREDFEHHLVEDGTWEEDEPTKTEEAEEKAETSIKQEGVAPVAKPGAPYVAVATEVKPADEEKIQRLVDEELAARKRRNARRLEDLEKLHQAKLQLAAFGKQYELKKAPSEVPLRIAAETSRRMRDYVLLHSNRKPDVADAAALLERSIRNINFSKPYSATQAATIAVQEVEPAHGYTPLVRRTRELIAQLRATDWSRMESEDPAEIRELVVARFYKREVSSLPTSLGAHQACAEALKRL